jgi:hypothetical protein
MVVCPGVEVDEETERKRNRVAMMTAESKQPWGGSNCRRRQMAAD